MRTGKLISLITIGVLMFVSLPASASIGRVMHMNGDVKVNGQDMRKNHMVRAGDKITTGANSSVMVVMSDKSVIDLQPNTKFQLQKFSFNRNKPKQGNSVMNLLRGSFRYISGLIGRTNHTNARIRMGTATAGIRGSLATFSNTPAGYKVDVSLGNMTLTFADGSKMTVSRGKTGQANSDGTGKKVVKGIKEGKITAAINSLKKDPKNVATALAGLTEAEQAMVVAAMVANREQLGMSKDQLTAAVKAVVSENKDAAPLMAAVIAGIAEDSGTATSLIGDIKTIDGVEDGDVDSATTEVTEEFGTLEEGETNIITTETIETTEDTIDTTTSTTTGGGGGTTSP